MAVTAVPTTRARRARPGDDRPPPCAHPPEPSRAWSSRARSIRAATASAPCTIPPRSTRASPSWSTAAARTSPSSSVPTEEHLPAVRELAAAGVHVLVEKPLAASGQEARALIAAVREAGLKGAVGHVERFNPALLELRRRLRDGQLGEVFCIATERVGPFPDRDPRRGRRQGPRHARPRPRALARRRTRRARIAPRPSTAPARARGPRARHRPPRGRRHVQLRRRLAVARRRSAAPACWASAECSSPTR